MPLPVQNFGIWKQAISVNENSALHTLFLLSSKRSKEHHVNT